MSHLELIEEALDCLMAKDSPDYPSLFEGGRYSLMSGGKRIRPLLTLATVEIFSDQIEPALQPASALELVHTYSLIHDDLPCMDDDDMRRGRPTLHKVYDEGHAVLTGDYLLTYAFELLATAPSLTAQQKVALTCSLAKGAGAEGMIGGQVMDIDASPDIAKTHALKTAALFRVALEFGGIIANVPVATLNKLNTFGTQFGLLFQMVDDVLDNDHSEGREAALTKAEKLYEDSLSLLSTLDGNTATLAALTTRVFEQLSTQHVSECQT